MLRSCHTCRQTRRGCDKSRPTCRTCRRNGSKCGGYSQDQEAIFINVNSSNVRASNKSIFANALRNRTQISKYDEQRSMHRECQKSQILAKDNIFGNSINCLWLTESDFKDHLSVLWNHFHLGHSFTSFAWAPSFIPLISQNRYLDLALIALSALRFSQTTSDSGRIRVMSLTAYGQSLRIFRQACKPVTERGPTKLSRLVLARLATTSLLYTMFEAMHESPRTIFSSGMIFDNPHLKGAKALIQGCGPSSFRNGGDHHVFKKLREMIIVDGFVHRERSFLADECWMDEPWQILPRTNRDRLFDVAVSMTVLVSKVLVCDLISMVTGGWTVQVQNLAKSLTLQIDLWEGEWHRSLGPTSLSLLFEFVHNPQSPPSLTPRESKPGTADIIFLQLELWSLKLLLAICASRVSMTLTPAAECSHTDRQSPLLTGSTVKSTQSDAHFPGAIAKKIETTLKLPVFGQNDEKITGLVEGQCRSLLPAWSLMEYERWIVKKHA